MAKYIRTYSNNSEYEAAKASAGFLTPNVGYIEDTKEVKYLNSKKDLYDIYGTIDARYLRSPYLLINGSQKDIVDTNGTFGYTWTGDSVYSLIFKDNEAISGGVKRFVTIEKIDTKMVSGLTTMSNMFRGCNSLTEIDLSNFNTSKVTDMNNAFRECKSLTSLDLSGFDTSSVTTMKEMFMFVIGMTAIDLKTFNTEKVTDMSSMFSRCESLKTLDISNWDTSAVTSMNGMFNYCYALTTVIMNSTNQTTFDMIKAQLVTDSKASRVTIIRDGVNWKYQNGAWVEV